MPRPMSARAGIGFVPQVHEIFARITVLDNLRMGLAYKRGNMAIVLVEQYYDFAGDLADDYLVMQRSAAPCWRAAKVRTWTPTACASWSPSDAEMLRTGLLRKPT